MNLPPLSENERCPKCLSLDNAAMRYCILGSWTTICSQAVPVGTMTAQEHIHRTCPQCDYQWLEATADAKVRPEA